jgi:LysM repeat protein
LATADSLIRARAASRSYQKDVMEQKRILNLLVGLSAVLFIVSFIMGAGLIQNQDRISSLERQVVLLSNSYISANASVSESIGRDGTASAFAADSSEAPITQTEAPAFIEANGNAILEEAQATEIPSPTPIPTPTPEPTPKPSSYTVQSGDTLISISLKFYGTSGMVERIMEFNNITDPNLIVSGKSIQLPPE